MPVDEAEIRRDVKGSVHDWLGIDLTDSQIEEILADDHVGNEARRWGVDTVVRERIGDYLAVKIVGKRWPLYGTPKEERDTFFETFEKNAEARGFTLWEKKR
jgi:hypothetical protein